MIKIDHYKFEDLTNKNLYRILQLRSEIFILEQQCLYLDIDDNDFKALHVIVKKRGKIIGYSRVMKKGNIYSKHSSIGRVLVSKSERRKNIGNTIIEYSIKILKKLYKNDPIKISAQTYLKTAYEKHGFVYKGEDYLEDGIPHCAMYFD
tara:strand:- start:402 stop:848 length:447 start_codon:yes stop_codon:yes gene_type:complete